MEEIDIDKEPELRTALLERPCGRGLSGAGWSAQQDHDGVGHPGKTTDVEFQHRLAGRATPGRHLPLSLHAVRG